MEFEAIMSLIGSYAFPIVMCLLMFKYMQDETKSHKEETGLLKDAINKLEVAITSLAARME